MKDTALRKVSQTLYLPDLFGTKDGKKTYGILPRKIQGLHEERLLPPCTPQVTDRPLTDFIETESSTPS